MTVSAVVFDLGGVLTESPMTAFGAYEAEAGLPEGLIVAINSTDPDTNAWARFERNELDVAGFSDGVRGGGAGGGAPAGRGPGARGAAGASCGRRWWRRCAG